MRATAPHFPKPLTVNGKTITVPEPVGGQRVPVGVNLGTYHWCRTRRDWICDWDDKPIRETNLQELLNLLDVRWAYIWHTGSLPS